MLVDVKVVVMMFVVRNGFSTPVEISKHGYCLGRRREGFGCLVLASAGSRFLGLRACQAQTLGFRFLCLSGADVRV